MVTFMVRSRMFGNVYRAAPITNSNFLEAKKLNFDYNIYIGDWIIYGDFSTWPCRKETFEDAYEIIGPEKEYDDIFEVVNTRFFRNSGHGAPYVEFDVRMNSYRFHVGVESTVGLVKMVEDKLNNPSYSLPSIKKVIFNNPATIVFWDDGTKTVSKCAKDDTFSEYAGLSICFTKKLLGKDFRKEMNKWCTKPNPVENKPSESTYFSKVLHDVIKKI